MPIKTIHPTMLGLLAAGILLPAAALAQANKDAAPKKLYCWNENGQRKCADSLPPEAMAAAREEINVRSGMRTGEVQRALTDEERAAQAEEEAKRKTEALAAETRRRTDQRSAAPVPISAHRLVRSGATSHAGWPTSGLGSIATQSVPSDRTLP